MKNSPASFELLEPVLPEALVPHSWIELWMILTLLGILLIAATWLILRKKIKAPRDPLLIRNAAYQSASTAFSELSPQDARDAAVQCSLILRRYLSAAANDPALFETHEEFISRHDALNALTEATRKSSECGFARLASLKYAADIPKVSALEVMTESKALLDTLHHGFLT